MFYTDLVRWKHAGLTARWADTASKTIRYSLVVKAWVSVNSTAKHDQQCMHLCNRASTNTKNSYDSNLCHVLVYICGWLAYSIPICNFRPFVGYESLISKAWFCWRQTQKALCRFLNLVTRHVFFSSLLFFRSFSSKCWFHFEFLCSLLFCLSFTLCLTLTP